MRKEIDYDQPLPRQKVYDPTTGKWNLAVPDCSHLHGFAQFMYPPVADERDLPGEEPERKDQQKDQGY